MAKCDHSPNESCGRCDGWAEVERLRAAIVYEIETGLWQVCGYDAFAKDGIPAVIERLEKALEKQ